MKPNPCTRDDSTLQSKIPPCFTCLTRRCAAYWCNWYHSTRGQCWGVALKFMSDKTGYQLFSLSSGRREPYSCYQFMRQAAGKEKRQTDFPLTDSSQAWEVLGWVGMYLGATTPVIRHYIHLSHVCENLTYSRNNIKKINKIKSGVFFPCLQCEAGFGLIINLNQLRSERIRKMSPDGCSRTGFDSFETGF